MIKLSCLLGCLFLLLNCVAENKWSEIRGRVTGGAMKEVSLYAVADGSLKLCGTVQVGIDSCFGFLLQPEYEGFYTIGSGQLNYPVYLKAGDKVNVVLRRDALQFTGKNTAENMKLAEWETLSATVRKKASFTLGLSSIYTDFFPELELLAKETPKFQAGAFITSSNNR